MYSGSIEQWFSAYANDVYNFLVYFTGTSDVEDLVQDTFTKALMALQKTGTKENPKAWLLSIAKNTAVDQIRRRRLKQWESDEVLATHAMPGDSVEAIVEVRDTKEYLLKSISHLKPDYRAVFVLRIIQGFPVQESAQILGWSTAKVRTTLHRAMKLVKRDLVENSAGGWSNEFAYR